MSRPTLASRIGAAAVVTALGWGVYSYIDTSPGDGDGEGPQQPRMPRKGDLRTVREVLLTGSLSKIHRTRIDYSFGQESTTGREEFEGKSWQRTGGARSGDVARISVTPLGPASETRQINLSCVITLIHSDGRTEVLRVRPEPPRSWSGNLALTCRATIP